MKIEIKNRLPWIIMVLLLLVGLGFSIYLTHLHISVFTDPNYNAGSSVCTISKGVNCETVAKNDFSVFMGVPVSVWGIFGNLLMIFGAVLGFIAPKSKKIHAYMVGFVGFSILVSILLGYISITKIHSICIFCFGTYFINGLIAILLGYVMFSNKSNPFIGVVSLIKWSLKKKHVSLGFVITGVAISTFLMMFYPRYWIVEEYVDSNLKPSDITYPVSGDRYETSTKKCVEGCDKKGNHWIGAKNPKLIIHEYSDYECPFCRKFHMEVRKIVNRYPDMVRLVHHHYPLDKECNMLVREEFHKKACLFSKYVMCAGKQNMFWKANDYVFNNRKTNFSIKAMALALSIDEKKFAGCILQKEMDIVLLEQVNEGVKKRLNSTPVFFVNGKSINPRLVASYVEKVINQRKSKTNKQAENLVTTPL
jgi:uncharacterized membrane protein